MSRREQRSRDRVLRLLTVGVVVTAIGGAFPALGEWDVVIGEACGDGIAQPGEECDPGYSDQGIPPDMLGKTCQSEGFEAGELACTETCRVDHSACYCRPGIVFPATGQTVSYRSGDDGDIRAGGALSFTDNGDGTITDNNTGLMWEQKDFSGGIHDYRNRYHWKKYYGWQKDWAEFISRLNSSCDGEGLAWCDSDDLCGAGGQCGLGGYRDWRMPNIRELQSIVNFRNRRPSITPQFDNNCAVGCMVQQCSCTMSSAYWSSSSVALQPHLAWYVSFDVGMVSSADKANDLPVRAVRGGL